MQNICVVNVILMTLKQYFNENHISIFKYSYIFGYCVISKFYTKKNLSMNGFIYKPLCTKLRLTVAKNPAHSISTLLFELWDFCMLKFRPETRPSFQFLKNVFSIWLALC